MHQCSVLTEISDFSWTMLVLQQELSELHLNNRDFGDKEALILSLLLSRVSNTLKVLDLRCFSSAFNCYKLSIAN